MAEHYASGNWHVKPGQEQEFVERWTEFLQWTRKDHPAMLTATLLRDENTPGHYVSIAEWADAQSRTTWKQSPNFATHFTACQSLCDHMTGSDYTREVTV
ncbi:quinol monooxygenase YgiN [Kribbella antiqua]|uniref:Quinol monooxygenase YgiN n=1 Tax=Kribbella antiqua TaxID=2512217 RepID=A0A4R2J182_9ACTN|nr:antibiotic biosynthesis monooxygenase family protein [Kribbella antiqua]TCO51192.1 quinol monooxygenase YgiN [Kribbella antiqua]